MWWIIGGIILAVVIWIGWELWRAPLMPDDYDDRSGGFT